MIRLLIADDQTAVRQALEVMLGLVEDLDVVGTAANGQEAVELAGKLRPDVVLMDLNMPVMGGAEATEHIVDANDAISIVVLTTFEDDESILRALRAGALGYLTKDADHFQIAQAVRSAHLGQSVLDPEVQTRLLRLASSVSARGGATGRDSAGKLGPIRTEASSLLTQREKEILQLIGAGLRNRDIADALTISEATVKTHINNIFTKADLHSRADAVRYALTVGGDAPEFTR
ncbi:LuxR family transcriptional regulator [Frondihabitans sp. PAMC 28766]|uniref:response regulator n=1 Tax=Frondihabitans sp. PAMC 28766 TaxID=1795630 RepID=UPI00078BC470|nr:response regulator transcription factor [Frondihabitans sp. PAMC 28766]AMM19441.1 LuxR family transcriptional regulator [Frondihabitans sp. PAMC 28766]